MTDNKNIEKVKEDYENLKKKYSLPDFKELEEEFDIGKVFEKDCETNFILRDIRKIINEKLSAYLHLFETFMNPASAPLFVLSMVKNLNDEDRKRIKELHKKIVKLTIIIMKLDTIYNEKTEAEFINLVFKEWKGMRKPIYEILERLDSEEKNNSENQRGYFG